jgi:hypothetical protein
MATSGRLAHVGRTDTLFSDDTVRVIHGRVRGTHKSALRCRDARRLHRELGHRRQAGRCTAIAEESVDATG